MRDAAQRPVNFITHFFTHAVSVRMRLGQRHTIAMLSMMHSAVYTSLRRDVKQGTARVQGSAAPARLARWREWSAHVLHLRQLPLQARLQLRARQPGGLDSILRFVHENVFHSQEPQGGLADALAAIGGATQSDGADTAKAASGSAFFDPLQTQLPASQHPDIDGPAMAEPASEAAWDEMQPVDLPLHAQLRRLRARDTGSAARTSAASARVARSAEAATLAGQAGTEDAPAPCDLASVYQVLLQWCADEMAVTATVVDVLMLNYEAALRKACLP